MIDWKIEKIVSCGNYLFAIVRGHPNAYAHDYILLHRVIMENHLGRLLEPYEVVHHKNENTKDNRIENLELMTEIQHKRLHKTLGKTMVELKCPSCGKIFIKEKRLSHLQSNKRIFDSCSRSCGYNFSHRIRKEGITKEIKDLLTENIIREFNSLNPNISL